ncbi:MAG: Phosphoenolpyruvate synthase [Candidatus Magasanikbacteria bacterium GW2011_GWA2_56_11]|uniref:Phosphoenolpyruvate synthase n=1 Tax=Candidatus Magasanikbacteria bacterium GW2011_GWA2_56_11 TaxID=1619044 RepID=A0A0G2B8N5_9BACT|nr:MAG: Phosphoenolpyruvate synthase [Candidatus Magasanikbacteria bacterium GW2011_GWA2_56_11]
MAPNTKTPIAPVTSTAADRATRTVLWFNEISLPDIPLVGGKNASLGEMYSKLTAKGIAVPNGFAITAAAYRAFLAPNHGREKIKKLLKDLDVANVKALRATGARVRSLILKQPLPKTLEQEIILAYRTLAKQEGARSLAVAVRSSATAEDLPDASFAGQQETYLNIRGERELLSAVRKCFASLFTDRAISYRETKGFDHLSVALSVTVQTMVGSGTGASGVMFTLDTESGFPGVVLINAAYGLGEYVVKGRVTPDQYYVFKAGLSQGKSAIISRLLGTKEVKLLANESGGTRQAAVRQRERNRFALEAKDILQLARWGVAIEEHYGRPQDIEWAKDGASGRLYIVQARPETVKTNRDRNVIETYGLKQTGTVLLSGTAVGQKIGAGKVRVIDSPRKLREFKAGEVLVTRITDPDWEPIMRLAAAIVTEQGGKTSHAAIVSRELGVPCVVGVAGARRVLATGAAVTVSCAEGEEGKIYRGILPFEVKRTELTAIPKTKTKIMMNVGDPDNAFPLSFLPHDGVGLAREEFIFSNFIRIHPLALVHYHKLKDKKAKAAIARLTLGYAKKSDYCVDKLAEGIARIAAAFHPRDVIVRLSDFKTNEYSALIGGREFGGLTNIIVMVPFCRTPEEGARVLKTMAEYGLKQGENGLKVYVMCEIPSNVVLADEFAKLFDGFSIGSNDLTQLALGIDRDSARLRGVADENHAAVKAMIREVIKKAHAAGKPIGICGQAPSDYPEFAEFLVSQGIDSISLNPDSLVAVRERVSYAERTVGKTGPKTNARLLGTMVIFAAVAAFAMIAGAGCAGVWERAPAPESGVELSPGQLRLELQEKLQREAAAKEAAEMAPLKVASFVDYEFDYPRAWDAEFWNGGVTVLDSVAGDYMSVFRQLVPHPVLQSAKESFLMGNVDAWRYTAAGPDGRIITIIEIPTFDGEVLEANLVRGDGADAE